ncbi:MAG: divalent-cation tolerance protein CutA [Myxococcales bacterium]|nr:divalent-cation tolerance protein CutA [Myxococcales bacterium]
MGADWQRTPNALHDGMSELPDPVLVVLCTAPTPEVGAKLARELVAQRLAACVNIVPAVRSIYEWNGQVEDETESQLVIKTRRQRWDALCAWLEQHHPYDTPEILALSTTAGSEGYLNWVCAQTR